MIRLTSITALMSVAFCSMAMAACPTSVPGTSAEAIQANELRVLCLQQELDERTQTRHFEQQLRANADAIRSLQMQRRFDSISPPVAPSPFVQPPPFVPN